MFETSWTGSRSVASTATHSGPAVTARTEHREQERRRMEGFDAILASQSQRCQWLASSREIQTV
jgi:hypothetical protein